MVYVWDLNPVLLQVGPFGIRWYSLVYVVGFLIAYWLLRQAVKRGEVKNMDLAGVDDFITWFIVSVIVFARLFYVVVYNPQYFFFDHLLSIFAVWQGGLSFHGGFVGAILAGWWYCKRRKVRFFQLADILVVPLALMLALGRIANFINGELPGKITTAEQVPWCVVFPHYGDACRHPSQIYEVIKNLTVFGVLLFLQLKKQLKEGTLFWLFIILYSSGRFITDIWRSPDLTDWLVGITGVAIGQWLNIIMFIVGVVMLYRITAKEGKTQKSQDTLPRRARGHRKKKNH